MKNLTAIICLTITLLLGSGAKSWSVDFQRGLTAIQNSDYATALREWTPLAKQGYAPAQHYLGVMYYNGHGVRKDLKTAAKWYELAAEQNYAPAQINLGVMYRQGDGVPQNAETAVKWYKLAAEQGYAHAQRNLGVMYEKGWGVPKDFEKAAKLYTLAAKQNYATAQTSLGVMYDNGWGVPKDHKTAVKWYTLAAKQGNALAQYNLGTNYVTGLGVPQNDETASNWFRLAAAQGDAPAQYNLGVMYDKGRGVPKDHKTAVKWYTLAAKQGNADAQINLGVKFAKGLGVPRDFVYAQMWFNIASSSGHKQAVKYRDSFAKIITSSQRTKSQNLARNFVPTKTLRIEPASKYQLPSISPHETEVQELRKKIARLKKEKEQKSKPKQVAKKFPKPTPEPKTSTSGSGFFVSKSGHVITNQHVVGDCKRVSVGENAKKQVTADILETDRRNDLALLKISSLKMASVETKSLIQKLGIKIVPLASDGLLRSEDVDLGEDVLVAGYPYGEIFSDTIKVTKGIVSSNKGLGDDSGQFQLDAAVQPGNSGGPIYDENGNIVGVVVAQLNKMKFAKQSGSMPENVNFGIKASTVKQFLTSSGLVTKWSKRSKTMSTRELAKIARLQTVMVMCHR